MTESPDSPATPQSPPQQPPTQAYPPAPPVPYAGEAPPPVGPRNGLGVAALVIAIIALVTCETVVLGIILGIVAIVLGFVGRGRAKRGEATNGGVAVAGVVLGFVAIVASVVILGVAVYFFNQVGFFDYVDCVSKAGGDRSMVQQCEDEINNRIEDRFGDAAR